MVGPPALTTGGKEAHRAKAYRRA